MTDRSEQIELILSAAVELRTPSDRAEYIRNACGGNADLQRQVEELVDAYLSAGDFLESPAPNLSPTIELGSVESPGTQIGRYKLLQQIGEGGMGVVFMAEQEQPVRRTVAVKIIKPGMDSRQVLGRFEAERQAIAMMDHPNIAKVLDAGATDTGRPYFVMELVKGVPITKYCDEHKLTLRERLALFLPVCQAIQHAHQKGVIHRDIKPTNILVAEYDSHPVPKVIDFGVAKATVHKLTDRTMFTEFGQVLGTLEYMSPEQAKLNQLDIDTRSDIYSLGVLLYELLTGSTPFDRDRLRSVAFDEVLRIIREEEAPTPSIRLSTVDALPSIAANRHTEPGKLSRDIRGELEWIVMCSLEKDRNRRYQTASAFAEDLQRYLTDQPVTARPATPGYRLKKFIRRNKASVAAASGVIGALVIGLAATTYFAVSASREAENAARALKQAERDRTNAEGINRFFTEEVFGLANPDRHQQTGITLVEALNVAAAKVEAKFPGDAELRAVVRDQLGEVYLEIDEPAKAIEQLEEALELRLRAFGGKDRSTLNTRGVLGFTYYKAGRWADAKRELEQTLRNQTSAFGVHDQDRYRTASCLCIVLMEMQDPGDLELAKTTYEQALDSFGPNHLTTLDIQSTYAWVMRWRISDKRLPSSKLSEALALAETATRGLRREAGDNSLRTMIAWYGYAACLRQAGRDREAADQFEQLLPVRYRILGPAHVDSLLTAWRVAECRRRANQPAEAVSVLADVQSRLPAIVAHEKVRRFAPLRSMANTALVLGRNDLAADFGLAAAQIYLAVYNRDGDRSLNSANVQELYTTLENIALAELNSGHVESAKRLGHRALELRLKTAEPVRADPQQTMKFVSELYGRHGHDNPQGVLEEIDSRLMIVPKNEGLKAARALVATRILPPNEWADEVVQLVRDIKDEPWELSPRKSLCRELAATPQAFDAVAAKLPEETALWIGRGQYHVMHNQLEAAEAGYAKVIRERSLQDEHFDYGCLLLLRGDTAEYQTFCRETRERNGDPPNGYLAYVAARLYGLGPAECVEPNELVKLAEFAAHDRRPWQLQALALAYIRAGRFREAISKYEETIPSAESLGADHGESWFGLAIANHKFGNDVEAQRCLTRGRSALQRARPKAEGAQANVGVPSTWLLLNLMSREAEALLNPSTVLDSSEQAPAGK